MDIEIKMPDVGLDEVEVIEILVKVNEKIEFEQGLMIIEGDKASMEIPSPISGIVKNICVNIGDKIKTNNVIMLARDNNTNSGINKEKTNCSKKEINLLNNNVSINPENGLKKNIFVYATPFIRRLARRLDIDLKKVTGTGRKNRILKKDVEFYEDNFIVNFSEKKEKIDFNNFNQIKTDEIEISNIQQSIGNNLHQNWINIPHVTQFDEVDITILEKFRQKYNSIEKNKNNKYHNITILIFILKVVARALEEFPMFNSSLTLNNKKIILKKYINIGVAMDIHGNLVVPVLKDINKKNIKQLSYELLSMSEKAHENKLKALDVKHGCFTISNLGSIGGSWFSPIINAPEVAILGISKSQIKPLWNGETFVPSLMLPLSLSYNHRVINGADAARFITFINKLLSDMHFLIM